MREQGSGMREWCWGWGGGGFALFIAGATRLSVFARIAQLDQKEGMAAFIEKRKPTFKDL